ncbi:hypothetical protein CYMTET_7988 [Cymbomonas tetramitiformis]|uniref:EGF-like domain-containing protein n=1 Tax=Cymbomonas tetramitiformis TaxID=36881 RepID=A0AAE0LGI9_9CHLO|nr:hypothetical protein CYMTET_7988 [Cymbomonas tetramitiformis]
MNVTDDLQADFVSSLASFAGISSSSISVTSVFDSASTGSRRRLQQTTAGSLTTYMLFYEDDVSNGVDPNQFLATAISSPSSVFAGSSNTLLSTAEVVTSFNWMASGSISISLPAMPSPPPAPPPAPPPCSADPCFPGVECENVVAAAWEGAGGNALASDGLTVAEARGYQCKACPSGYEGDGVECADLDECAVTPNGGCDNATACINLPDGAGRSCTMCPEGMTGSGETECIDDNVFSSSDMGMVPLQLQFMGMVPPSVFIGLHEAGS